MRTFLIVQLEKAREAVDAANIRAAYVEVMTAELTGDTTTAETNGKTVDITQKDATWSTTIDWPSDLNGANSSVTVNGIATLKYNTSTKKVDVTYSAKSGS